MATKPSEHNKFIGLKKLIASIHKDIAFMKKCNEHHVAPISHQIRIKTQMDTTIVRRMESELVKESIKKLYSKLNSKTLECYSLHLKLAKEFPVEFPMFLTKVKVAEDCESERKRKLLSRKFKQLISPIPKPMKPAVQDLEGFVINRSSYTFSDEQLSLLNKGLNYAVSSRPNLENIIIDTETAIHNKYNGMQPAQVISARTEIANVIREGLIIPQNNTNEARVTKELIEKPVYYLRADKGNSVVIMDRETYDSQVTEKLSNKKMFKQQRDDPLPEMIKDVNNTLQSCKDLLESRGKTRASLIVPNPALPRIKALPKVHKPGNEMREIISAVNAPTHRIAKWLVEEFKNMPKPFPSRSIINTQEFTQRLLESCSTIAEDEIMVSFDVKALFPSIPVNNAVGLIGDWLKSQYEEPGWIKKANQYKKLVTLCMQQSYFQFRDTFYRQLQGAPMGNSLAPFCSDTFMADLEQKLEDNNQLPERWWRYVDDVFCIIKRDSLTSVLDTINKAHKNIQFTYETEVDGKLPFLDILVVREPSISSPLSFEIYRKPTNTRRTIPASSNHSYQHKMAAYHHMIHRMLTLPLSEEGKQKELEYIFETARINGYKDTAIQAIINKKEKGLHKSLLTTLTTTTEPLRRVAVEFDKNLTRPLRPKLEKYGIDLVFSSRSNQLQSVLGSTKDPVKTTEKPGIYKVSCSHCDKVYIGQTKRTLTTRLMEHLKDVETAKKDMKKGYAPHFKSSVAEHIVTQKHSITIEDATIIRPINKPSKLDAAESLEIYKHDQTRLLNKGPGNASTWLFKLLPRRDAHTQVPTNSEKVVPTSSTNSNATAWNLQSSTGH